MSFEIAKEEGEFWAAYYDNVDERCMYGDDRYTPEQFYKVWIDRIQFEKKMEKVK